VPCPPLTLSFMEFYCRERHNTDQSIFGLLDSPRTMKFANEIEESPTFV